MHLVNIKLLGSEVADHIHVLHELLHRTMFGLVFLELGFGMTGDRISFNHFLVVETGVVKFYVGSGWDLMEVLLGI